MKKILLFVITLLVLVACDSMNTPSEPQVYGVESTRPAEPVEKEFMVKSLFVNANVHIRSITYEGHEYLVVFYSNGAGVDVEMLEINTNNENKDGKE